MRHAGKEAVVALADGCRKVVSPVVPHSVLSAHSRVLSSSQALLRPSAYLGRWAVTRSRSDSATPDGTREGLLGARLRGVCKEE